MQLTDQMTIKGEYTAVALDEKIERSSKVIDEIRVALRNGNKQFLDELTARGIIHRVQKATNLIPTVGRNVLARILAGDTTYTGEVDYGALGNGSSPSFTNSSTQLVSEVYRSQADSQAYDDNIAYIDWFVAAGDVANGTYTEFGAFIDGTVTANSGRAWSLLATGGWVKSGSIFISAKYTLV